ncbi:MAG: hypothetical protein H0V72_29610 [Bradyrhizobium sp.]|nr:hypothetical protein [Bradyrhizobium sp.]
MRKLIAFDDDTFDKLTQLGRDRMGTIQELADEAFADLLKKHGIPIDLKDALRKSARLSKTAAPSKEIKGPRSKNPEGGIMTTDPDPFEQGQRAARENIPAEANPYQDGGEQHALWAAGHEKVASAAEANEAEGT